MVVFSPRAGKTSFPPIPIDWPDSAFGDEKAMAESRLTQVRERQRTIAQVVNGVLDGRVNCTGNFTLEVSSLITVVRDHRCGIGSVIVLMPNSESSGGEMGVFVNKIGVEISGVPTFTVNHASDARTDRSFRYVIMGTSTIESSTTATSPSEPDISNPDFANVVLLTLNGDGSEGGQDSVDKSNSVHTLTWVGAAAMDTGVQLFNNPTLLLDGTNDWVTIPDHADFGFGAGDFTIEAWMYPTAGGVDQSVVSQWFASQDDLEFTFRLNTDDKFQFAVTNNGVILLLNMIAGIPVNLNHWGYLVAQREGDAWTIWYDGVKTATATNSNSIHNGGDNPDLIIGAIQSGTRRAFSGNIGPIRITKGEAVFVGSPTTIGVPIDVFPEA